MRVPEDPSATTDYLAKRTNLRICYRQNGPILAVLLTDNPFRVNRLRVFPVIFTYRVVNNVEIDTISEGEERPIHHG